MDDKDGKSPNWTGAFLFLAFGLAVFLIGAVSTIEKFNLGNVVVSLIGAGLSAGAGFEVKMQFNIQKGSQVRMGDRGTIKGDVYQGGRDIIIHPPPPKNIEKPEKVTKKGTMKGKVKWSRTEDPDFDEDDTKAYGLEFEKGDVLKGTIKSDYKFSAYLVDDENYRKFKAGKTFEELWSSEKVNNSDVYYPATEDLEATLVIEGIEDIDDQYYAEVDLKIVSSL